MRKIDFSKFPQSAWHSAVALICALLASVLIILCANALKNLPKDTAPISSEISSSAIEAEKQKLESEGK